MINYARVIEQLIDDSLGYAARVWIPFDVKNFISFNDFLRLISSALFKMLAITGSNIAVLQ